jgi:hypothetical protein
MPRIVLPKTCSQEELLKCFDKAGLNNKTWSDLDLASPQNCFFTPSGLTFLTSWSLLMMEKGRRIDFLGEKEAWQYLNRMRYFEHIGHRHSEGEINKKDRAYLTPISLIEDSSDVFSAVDAICYIVVRQFPDADKFLPALEWAVNEIIDNTITHAESVVPGAVSAQFYPRISKFVVSICDTGRGIQKSMSESHSVFNHAAAVKLAIQKGVTRNHDVGQGNGLAGTIEIIKENQGQFLLTSGDVMLEESEKGEVTHHVPEFHGTSINLSFDTNRPVDLQLTTIAGKSSITSWNYLISESERIQEAGGILVKQECEHTGGRIPAKLLRREIESLLPHCDGLLVINFEGVKMTSSSFLDELLGRLVIKIGKIEFQKSISIVNMNSTIQSMANNVIDQRLSLVVDE